MRKIFPIAAVIAASSLLWGAEGSAAASTPKMLVEIADLANVAISPDGAVAAFRRETASVERNTYDTAWFIAPLGGASPPRPIADGGAPLRYNWGPPIIEPPVWSPDSRWIYYRALFEGQVQVWRAARDGARAEPVTRDGADVESFALTRDGRSLLYTVGATREAVRRAEEDEYDQGVHIDDTVWIGQGLFRSGFVNGRLATQRYTGEGFEEAPLLAGQPKRHRVVDLLTLQTRDATDAETARLAAAAAVDAGGANPQPMLHAPTGPWTAATHPVPDALHLFKRKSLLATTDRDPKTVIPCPAAACQDADIAAIAWRPGHDELVFWVNDEDRGRAQSLYAWDITANTVRRIVEADGLLNGGRVESGQTPCAIGERFAICIAAAPNTPPRLERVDLQNGARVVLDDPNRALHDGGARPVQLLRWRDDQGRAFTGQFFPPSGGASARPAPLFITYYGCPGYVRGGTPGDEWPLATMAGDGIAALCINMPFGLPMEATDRYGQALSAVRSIIDRLAERQVVDRTRVGMGGLSFGSEVTYWVAMKSNLLAAASVTSTFASPTYYWFVALKGDPYLDVVKKAWGLGAPDETPARWKALSPAYNIDKIHTPLLMQMPEQEYLQTMDFYVPLARSATPVDLYVFPEESHQKVLPRHKLAAYERNLDWFRFWLQGYVDPDPAKAAQYARWQAQKDRAAKAGLTPGQAPPARSPSG